MKKIIFTALMALCLYVPQAQAYVINATLTADNHYLLYYGDVNGNFGGGDYMLRNEEGPSGDGAEYNWSLPESVSFDIGATDYLYVVAWNEDDITPVSWIGQFSGDGIYPIFSNDTSWESIAGTGTNNAGWGGRIDDGEIGNDIRNAEIQQDIVNGHWQKPGASAPNGSGPWGTIPGVSSEADFIWHDAFNNSQVSSSSYAIFRTLPIASTPEPATMVLFGMGLAGLGVLRRRQFTA
jgi:hypothetical protein